MFLALREMRRAKVRFSLLMAALGLLVFLILFQQAIQNGLITSFVGAIRNQSAPVLVFSVDGRRNLQGSVIPPPLEATVLAVDGIGRAGRIGQGTFTVTAGGELRDAAIIGYESEGLGDPTTLVKGRRPTGPSEAVASEADAPDGFDVGDVVRVEPGGLEITVVGLARDVQLSVSPTLFVTYRTYLDAVVARNPDAATPLPNVLALEPAAGVSADELIARVNAASDQADALTAADAADKAPGVSEVRSSFAVVFLLYALVVPLVTGLFFLIITYQKAGALTLLRAVGAPGGRLVWSLLVQVLIVTVVGLAIGVVLYAPLSVQRIGGVPLRFDAGAVVFWSVLIVMFSLASALVAASRVLRIDPVDATTGAGAGRMGLT